MQAQNHPASPLDASPKGSLTLTTDGPDTPLQSPPVGLKLFDDGQPAAAVFVQTGGA
jgi:hypothetical protein